MRHWTFDGVYAGRPFCGINKTEAKKKGDTFIHYVYDRNKDTSNLCPDCKRMIDSLDDDKNDILTFE